MHIWARHCGWAPVQRGMRTYGHSRIDLPTSCSYRHSHDTIKMADFDNDKVADVEIGICGGGSMGGVGNL